MAATVLAPRFGYTSDRSRARPGRSRTRALALRSCALLAALLWCAAAVAPFTTLRGAEPANTRDPVIAKGKGFEIRMSELDDLWKRIETESLNFGRIIAPEERDGRRATLVDRMVFNKVALLRATPADHAKGKERATTFEKDLRTRLGTDANFIRQIARSGMDEDSFRRLKIEEATILEVVHREVREKIVIPDEAIQKYYADNAASFDRPDFYRVQHILLATRDPVTGGEVPPEIRSAKRKQAEDVLERVRKGEDFSEAARKFSEDVRSRGNGGEVSFAKGSTILDFESAVAAMRPGQLSGVVTTGFGFHIIKMIDHRPAGRVSVSEAEKDIRNLLTDRELEKRLVTWAEQLRTEYAVEITGAAPKLPERAPAKLEAPKQ